MKVFVVSPEKETEKRIKKIENSDLNILKKSLEALEYVKTAPTDSLPSVRLTWQDSKTDLAELIYLLDSKRSFGNVPLTQLAAYIANVFNICIVAFSSLYSSDNAFRSEKRTRSSFTTWL